MRTSCRVSSIQTSSRNVDTIMLRNISLVVIVVIVIEILVGKDILYFCHSHVHAYSRDYNVCKLCKTLKSHSHCLKILENESGIGNISVINLARLF